ncbi:unnamed protein product [Trichogramma brassicae]|uniref:G-protein coupled receptors family 1 profile domain-containing protein n=1 Tax=Trichogramma brassicae TaxID=86971 RepID=A0A6H5IZ92_9HYME|nr:unnamed protein product [Trichogramma brassicae]
MENTTNDTMSGVGSGIEEDERDNDLVKVELLVLSVIFLVTLMGNSLVLFAIYLRRCRGRRQRLTRMHFFVMHLSIADLITGLLNVLPQLAWDITFRFQGGEILCKLVKFGQPLGSYLSSYVLMATAADRYHAICYPLSYCRTTSRRSRITVYTAWILSLLLCLPQIFIFSIQEIAPGIWDCWATFDLPYAKKAYVTCVLTFTYVEICLSIWNNREVAMLESQQALQPQIRARNQGSLISKAKINTIKQTLAVVILYAASSMPFIGAQLWSAWDPYAAESAFFKGMREPDVHDTVAAEQLDEQRQSLDLSHVQLRAAHRADEIFAQPGEARSSLEFRARDELADFYENLPDHEEVQQLSNEQFKQKLDYLKRKQRILLKNLRNCLEQDEATAAAATASATNLDRLSTASVRSRCPSVKSPNNNNNNTSSANNINELSLKAREARNAISQPSSAETRKFYWARATRVRIARPRPRVCHLAARRIDGSRLCPNPSVSPPSKTIDKIIIDMLYRACCSHCVFAPIVFCAREDAEKYMSQLEHQLENDFWSSPSRLSRKSPAKKRRIRRIPLTSKIPMYDKLCAEKAARYASQNKKQLVIPFSICQTCQLISAQLYHRSRFIREECALNLMSQVRPFKLECDRRAMRALTRSSPELRSIGSESGVGGGKKSSSSTRFRAKPVPRHLLSSDVYDRMLEDEYFRNIQKRIRAAELLRSSSLPPSMARRDRCKSATSLLSSSIASKSPEDHQQPNKSKTSGGSSSQAGGGEVPSGRADTPLSSSLRAHSLAMTTASLPPHGNNIAAMLRAQASRHEHERDMDFRASLRRDEAREQAERHRMQMEMMLDRVTRIPTLFERYSQDDVALTLQSFQNSLRLCPRLQDSFCFEPSRYLHHHHHAHHQQQQGSSTTTTNHNNNNNNNGICSSRRKKKTYNCGTSKHRSSSSADSYASLLSMSSERPNSVGSLTSSSPDYDARKLYSRLENNCGLNAKKRGPLRVSINEKAELIDDDHANMTSHHHHHHHHQCSSKKDKERTSSECLNSGSGGGGPRL